MSELAPNLTAATYKTSRNGQTRSRSWLSSSVQAVWKESPCSEEPMRSTLRPISSLTRVIDWDHRSVWEECMRAVYGKSVWEGKTV
jgi:hypothetical protein